MTVAAASAARSAAHGGSLAAGLPMGRRTPRGRERWYLAQVPEGRELSLSGELRRILPRPILSDAFVPRRERWVKRAGTWSLELRFMHPGFVFVASCDALGLNEAFGSLTLPVKLVGAEGRAWTPIADEARAWFTAAMDSQHVVRSSTAVIEDGALHVLSGPLVGQEGCIVQVNRHKRFCRVRVCDTDGGFVESMPLDVVPEGGDAR